MFVLFFLSHLCFHFSLFSFLLCVQGFFFDLSSICSPCPTLISPHSDKLRYDLNPATSSEGGRKKQTKKAGAPWSQRYSGHNLACSGMHRPCSALQWRAGAQGGRGSTWWRSRRPNQTSWGLKTTTIWPSDDNDNLSVGLPAPCGCDIREELLLCFARVYSASNRPSPLHSVDAVLYRQTSLCLLIYGPPLPSPALFVTLPLFLALIIGHTVPRTCLELKGRQWEVVDGFQGPRHQFYKWSSLDWSQGVLWTS